MKKLMKYVKPEIWFIILTVVVKFAGTYAELWIPSLMETMLDDIVPTGDTKKIYMYGGMMLLCAAFCLVLNILANRNTAFSSGRITKAIRHDLFKKLQSLSARQMDALTIASAESRLTSDTYHVNNMLTRVQRMGIRAPILLVGGIIMLIQMDWTLALVTQASSGSATRKSLLCRAPAVPPMAGWTVGMTQHTSPMSLQPMPQRSPKLILSSPIMAQPA